MKIVAFHSGLGNQIFFYLFCLYLRDKGHDVYLYSRKKWLNKHNGLEIDAAFNVELPPQKWYSNLAAVCVRSFSVFVPSLRCFDSNFNEHLCYFDGFWQDKRFFNDNVTKLEFRTNNISERNKQLLLRLHHENSVSIHIRRGDYLDECRRELFGKSCPSSYYKRAMEVVEQKLPNPFYVVFSDDIQWAKENLDAERIEFVDWNRGADSYVDMYLMSQCKGNIIANSSFSYWGAMLGREKTIVIRPERWIGNNVPDIFPESWIALK